MLDIFDVLSLFASGVSFALTMMFFNKHAETYDPAVGKASAVLCAFLLMLGTLPLWSRLL